MTFHEYINMGGNNIENIEKYAQKEYKSYICSFHYCFPQVCLVFNPISAIYLPNISPRRRAGRARPEGRSTPPPTASVQGSRVCVWAKRRAKRISCKARCSVQLFSRINHHNNAVSIFAVLCERDRDCVTLYSRDGNEISR